MGERNGDLEVAIVGGGLAGLSAAVALGRAGVRVGVYERSTTLGGRAASRLVGDYVLELGPHALYASGAARRGLQGLGIEVRGSLPRPRAAATLGGRYHKLPMGAASLLSTSLLGIADKLRLGRLLSELQGPSSAARLGCLPPELTATQWIAERLPPGPGRILMESLVRLSNYSGHPEQSATVALRQLRLAVTDGVLYLDGGWRSLVDALEHAAAASVRLHTGARIEGLRFLDDSAPAGWQLDLADGRQVSADQVLLACAPNVARRLLERSPHPITRAARARLSAPRAASYAACLQVALDPSTSGRFDFILGLDRPDYLSVFSLVADVAPHGSEVIHVMRYLDQSEATADTRAELEALLDAARPNWRRRVCEASYQPRLCVTNWVETVRHPRPDCELAPGLFAAGDWIAGHGVLADAAVGSALEVSQRILGQRAEAAPRNAHLFATAGAVGELWS